MDFSSFQNKIQTKTIGFVFFILSLIPENISILSFRLNIVFFIISFLCLLHNNNLNLTKLNEYKFIIIYTIFFTLLYVSQNHRDIDIKIIENQALCIGYLCLGLSYIENEKSFMYLATIFYAIGTILTFLFLLGLIHVYHATSIYKISLISFLFSIYIFNKKPIITNFLLLISSNIFLVSIGQKNIFIFLTISIIFILINIKNITRKTAQILLSIGLVSSFTLLNERGSTCFKRLDELGNFSSMSNLNPSGENLRNFSSMSNLNPSGENLRNFSSMSNLNPSEENLPPSHDSYEYNGVCYSRSTVYESPSVSYYKYYRNQGEHKICAPASTLKIGNSICFTEHGGRLNLYCYAIEKFFESPFYGHGIRSYSLDLCNIYNQKVEEYKTPHNFFLHIMYELGIIGFIVFCSYIFYITLRTYYLNATPEKLLIISLLISQLSVGLTTWDYYDLRFLFLINILISVLHKAKKNKLSPSLTETEIVQFNKSFS